MRILPTVLTFMLGLASASPTFATSVLPTSLQHLAKAAELVIYGKAISNEVKLDETSGRVATFTTFKVIEIIKGQAGDTHTIKQLGGQLPGSNRVHTIHGMPRFTVDAEYVVFLPKMSELGFASPLGLGQGQFTVRNQNSVTSVSNGRAISSLTDDKATTPRTAAVTALRALPENPASAELVEFLQTVRELAAE